MAILARGVDQHPLYLARGARLTFGRILGRGQTGKLYLVDSRDRCLLRRCVGAGMALALSAQADQGDTHGDHVSHHDHRLHGEQYLSSPRG